METDIKRVALEDFRDAAAHSDDRVTTIEFRNLKVEVKKYLLMSEVAQFVNVCTKACFDSDDGTYVPEAKDIAIRSSIVAFYTNIELPEDVAEQYDLINKSGIIDAIMGEVDRHQLSVIIDAVGEKISHIARANISRFEQQLTDACNMIHNIGGQFSDLVKDISSDDIERMMDVMSSGKIDERKLVDAYMDNKK